MRKLIKGGLIGVGIVALAAGPAFADIQPSSTDVVGVGSDTVQNIMNFAADGSPNGNGVGYNATVSKNRVFNFNATPDENDRAGYANGSTGTALKPLNPTIVLRQGESPVQRPNGSGSGIKALLADTTAPYDINYVRASRPPTAAEQTAAGTAGFGPANNGLRVVQISTDLLAMAVNGQTTKNGTTYAPTYNTNAPQALSKAQLKSIYSCSSTTWTQVGGTSSDTIIPLIPQTGSGTRSTFLSDIGFGTATPGSCVQTVEENDPTSITGASNPMDAIAPFSQGRINLYANGYFTNPATVYPGGTALTPGVAELANTNNASDGIANYTDSRGLYIIFRANDAVSPAVFQPGGTQNFANSLFIGANPFVNGTNGRNDIAAAGVTPNYSDLGNGYSVG